METIGLVGIVLGYFLALYSKEYWGPGLRNVLNAIGTRISGKAPVVDQGTHESSLISKTLWVLAVPTTVAACIAIWEWLR